MSTEQSVPESAEVDLATRGMGGHLPTMPSEDHDFTPEIARKIILLYRTRIEALEADSAKVRELADEWHAAAESREFSPTRDELKSENERLRAAFQKCKIALLFCDDYFDETPAIVQDALSAMDDQP